MQSMSAVREEKNVEADQPVSNHFQHKMSAALGTNDIGKMHFHCFHWNQQMFGNRLVAQAKNQGWHHFDFSLR